MVAPSNIDAELVDASGVAILEPPFGATPRAPRFRFVRRAVVAIGLGIEWLFGVGALIIGLAVLSAIPAGQFLSLGYMLEVSGRIARTGRFTAGFVGVRRAARVGSMLLGIVLLLIPARIVISMWHSAAWIDPDSRITRLWGAAAIALSVVVGLHMIGACFRGGRLRHFLWPIVNPLRVVRRLRQGGMYRQARDAVWDFVTKLRLPHYFWLGLRGFIGGTVWLAIPVTMLAATHVSPVLPWVGVVLLIPALYYLPFLEARFAAENRLAAMFEIREVRRLFARAPIAFFVAFCATLLLALPLYLLKIEMVPREAAWLPTLAFVVFIFPARLLTGWAYARSLRHEKRRNWFIRAACRLLMLPVAGLYLLILWLTQYTAWHGIWSLYEQHAFLVPVPFFAL